MGHSAGCKVAVLQPVSSRREEVLRRGEKEKKGWVSWWWFCFRSVAAILRAGSFACWGRVGSLGRIWCGVNRFVGEAGRRGSRRAEQSSRESSKSRAREFGVSRATPRLHRRPSAAECTYVVVRHSGDPSARRVPRIIRPRQSCWHWCHLTQSLGWARRLARNSSSQIPSSSRPRPTSTAASAGRLHPLPWSYRCRRRP